MESTARLIKKHSRLNAKRKGKGHENGKKTEWKWNGMPPATGMLQLLYLFSVFKFAADASEKGYILANAENIQPGFNHWMKLGII